MTYFLQNLPRMIFSYEFLNFIRSYLTDRKQRIRINHTYGLLLRYNVWCPPSFYSRLSLFSIDICDIFLWNSYFSITSYGDDNTPYIDGPIGDLVKIELEIFLHKSFQVVQRKPHDI